MLRQLGHVHPAPLLPGLEAQFGELDALGTFDQIVGEWLACGDVPEEHLPLRLEGVLWLFAGRYFEPLRPVVVWVRDVGVPDGDRRVGPVLRLAVAQARDGAPHRAVYLQLEELVAVYPNAP